MNSFKDMQYLDVVDCSHLEHNTNWNFHNYFFMNLSIIGIKGTECFNLQGDIRDIIVNKKRGHKRGERLVPKHSFQNSFQFKSVPSGLGLS